MYLIYLCLTISLIMVNIAGLTVVISRYFSAQASARLLGLLVLTLAIFALEHLYGLGKLAWLWPFSTALSLLAIHRYKNRQFWMSELVFVGGFAYGLVWRFAFPNIDAGTEHITDLYFISNFMGGQTLPAKDRWLVGSLFDFYYAFQHYDAALLGRIFNLEVGLAMNLAWSLLMALLVSLGWEISGYFVKQKSLRLLLLVALITGGNGLSPLMPFMINNKATDIYSLQTQAINTVWANTRFAGMYDEHINTAFGRAIEGDPKAPGFAENLELPLETIAYYSVLGDYHPPLGGFVIALWTLSLSAFLGLRKVTKASQNLKSRVFIGQSSDAIAFFAIGLTPALILVTNAWVFPLQCILVTTWVAMRYWKADVFWQALLAGCTTGFILIYPFLGYFATGSLITPINLVTEHDHSPIKFLLAIQWPLFIWIITGLIIARYSAWAGWLALTLLAIFCLSEMVYVDDPFGDKCQRFNTTLKWWSWLWPTALIGLGSVCLGLGGRLIKIVMILSLMALLVYTVDIGRYWHYINKPQFGQLSGDGWLKQDATQRELLTYLKNAPDGIVLESIEQGAYSNSTALTLFANKSLVLGWPDHVNQWRGYPAYVTNQASAIRAFYKAELLDPLKFLKQYPVQTIIWSLEDEQRMPNSRLKLQDQINPDYYWRAFYENGDQAVGVWERRFPLSSKSVQPIKPL